MVNCSCAWCSAWCILRALLDAVKQSGPGPLDLDVDLAELSGVCAQARAYLYKYTGKV